MKSILDLGSNTAKLYQVAPDGSLKNTANASWRLLEAATSPAMIRGILTKLMRLAGEAPQLAIGTAAFRRSPRLAKLAAQICTDLGIPFRVISQVEEAELIRLAALRNDIPPTCHLVNVGGGSVQIIHPDRTRPSLLDFGIADLNAKFSLAGAPGLRQTADAIEWVAERAPEGIGDFAYTGGERAYLRSVGAALEANGRCSHMEFLRIAQELEALPTRALRELSPYDPSWMQGAVASNCIVLALLSRAGLSSFLPVDLNISDGLLSEICDARR